MGLLNDILGVNNPQVYYCKVWSYLVGHSQLLIRVYKDDFVTGETFYLLFTEVMYFEGPMSWQGVDFYFGTPEECWELLRDRPGFNELPERDRLLVLEKVHLFKIGSLVKILARGIYRSEDFPPDFFWLQKRQHSE